ncbi:MAG TPA: mannitol dehydrogenase family protein [Steroidobacteraceae bacterium]
MSALRQADLRALATRGVQVPGYDRERIGIGVLHFGPGAFHRVHQSCYFDDALAADPRWGIAAVSLHSSGVRDALAPQDHLYTLAVLDETTILRVVGAIKEVLVAPESPSAITQRLADPAVNIVTMTVTEKGYCLTSSGSLDFSHPELTHDLAQPNAPRSLIGHLCAGLARRRALGIAAPNIVSCDNLTDNGPRLRRAVVELAQRHDFDLARWIEDEVPFPRTMVDSITPATDAALRDMVADRLGVIDRWPVQREAFSQWVIEDCMQGAQPDWAALGVTITGNVAGFERAKLRLLNGAHSSLAYLGLAAGHETVAQAMRDPEIASLVRRLMIEDIAPAVVAPRGLDVADYIESILRRFRNPALRYQLLQIAGDSSQKLPFRLLGTVLDAVEARRPLERLCLPIAAWFHFARRKAQLGERVLDPLAEQLFAIGIACSGDAAHDVRAFLSLERVFPATLVRHSGFVQALTDAYAQLLQQRRQP